ncbi:phosphonopyruvate decarboxylase [Alphaproteobacteria bacterium HT1-32]|nr:phosphonopyruvate decarboxylase [Alphaproteobacteria bacterium HT1-32]
MEWPDQLFAKLIELNIRQVAYVPDAGHARLIESCRNEDSMKAIPLTTEEEGIALLAGAWLGGERGVLLMQSSGVGNCVNMLSLAATCRFPLLMLVTQRGEWAEFNPWQIPMGQNSGAAIEMMGGLVYRVDDTNELCETVDGAGSLVFNGNRSAAVLMSQRMIGRKVW